MAHQRSGNGGSNRTMQQFAHDRALPGSIEIKTNLARFQNFPHAHSDGGAWNAIDVATRCSDRVDRACFAAERDDACGQVGKRFVIDALTGFRWFVEREMTVDADPTEGDIDTTAALKSSGVLAVLSHLNAPRLKKLSETSSRGEEESNLAETGYVPFSDATRK